MKKYVALLPLKAHSERVADKNVRLFCGRPLYQWIVDVLNSVDAVAHIVINTDSDRILVEAPRLSRKVITIQRPHAICGDFVSMNRIIEYDMSQVSGDCFLQTHATNPLLQTKTIQHALDGFQNSSNSYDSLFSVNKYQSRFYDHERVPINHDPQSLVRTQDLSALYEENSCLYLFTRESFSDTGQRIGRKPMLFETPLLESVDIDDEETWQLAERLAKANHS